MLSVMIELIWYAFDGRLLRGLEDQRPGKTSSAAYKMSGGLIKHFVVSMQLQRDWLIDWLIE